MRRFTKKISSWRHRRHGKNNNDHVEPAPSTPARSSQAPLHPKPRVQNGRVEASVPVTAPPEYSRQKESTAIQKSAPLQAPLHGSTEAHSSQDASKQSPASSNIATETKRFSSDSLLRRKPIPNDQTVDHRNSPDQDPSVSALEELLSTSTLSSSPPWQSHSKQLEEPTLAETLQIPKQHYDPRIRADSGPGNAGNTSDRKETVKSVDPGLLAVEDSADYPKPLEPHAQMSPIVEQPIDWNNEHSESLEPTNVTSDTDIHTTQAPAVTHETVHRQIREEITEVVTREIHNYDVLEHILPVIETEVLPTKHFVLDEEGKKVEVDPRFLPNYWQNFDHQREVTNTVVL